jgi:hypothetical protein
VALQNGFNAGIKLDNFNDTTIGTIYRTEQSFTVHQKKAYLGAAFLFQRLQKFKVATAGKFGKIIHMQIEISCQFSAGIGIANVFLKLNGVNIMFGHTDFCRHLTRGNTAF